MASKTDRILNSMKVNNTPSYNAIAGTEQEGMFIPNHSGIANKLQADLLQVNHIAELEPNHNIVLNDTLYAEPTNTLTTTGEVIKINYDETVTNGNHVNLIEIDAKNRGGAGTELFPLRVNIDCDTIDTGAGLCVVNSGKADCIYLNLYGKTGEYSNPSGIGCDINKGDNDNEGVCYHAWDHSTTDRGEWGPTAIYYNKVNNPDSNHRGFFARGNRNSIWLDTDITKTTQKLMLINNRADNTKPFYITCDGLITTPNITPTALTASKPVFTDANKKLTSTGTMPIAQGGTNATSQTTNGVNYYNGTSITSDSNLTWTTTHNNLVVKGDGEGGTDSYAPLEIWDSTGTYKNFIFSNAANSGSPWNAYGLAGVYGYSNQIPYMGEFIHFNPDDPAINGDKRIGGIQMYYNNSHDYDWRVFIVATDGASFLTPFSINSTGTITQVYDVNVGQKLNVTGDIQTNTNLIVDGTTTLTGSVISDCIFEGDDTGLPYGSCWGNEIGWSQANAAQNTWYAISDADMSDGQLHNVTHDGSGKLTLTTAGRYLINWSWAGDCNTVGKHVQLGISKSGSVQSDGMNHFYTATASQEYTASGTAILDCAASATIEVAMRTTDTGTPTLTTDHLNITVVHVGGT